MVKGKIKKLIAVLIAVILAAGFPAPISGMEISLLDTDVKGGSNAGDGGGGNSRKKGELRAFFKSNNEWKTLPVLYDETKDILRVNPDSFNGYLNRYRYDFDSSERIGIVTLSGMECPECRSIAFEAGSSVSWMKFDHLDSEHNLSEPAVCFEDELWVPADDFFHYIHADTLRIAVDGDESSWDPGTDYVLIDDPRLTLPDLLLDVFREEFGTNWFFDYKNDFGLSDGDLRKKETAARAATSLHHVASADVSYMFRVGTLPFTQLVNAVSSFVMQKEEGSFARDYEKCILRISSVK